MMGHMMYLYFAIVNSLSPLPPITIIRSPWIVRLCHEYEILCPTKVIQSVNDFLFP